MINNGFCTKKSKNTTTLKPKSNNKNPCQTWELNPGPLTPQYDVIRIGHRDN